MTMPKVGAKAPGFALPDQSGETRTLDAYAGQYVVLYFYPKDDTPGCTVEACSFRDEHSALQSEGAVVLGVSPDSTARHQRFAEKYSLPFPLLADTENKVATDYGVWTLKKNYGREYMGIQRSTFLIGPDGTVAHVWEKVKTKGHATEVLEALKAVKGGEVPAAPSRVKDAARRAKATTKGAKSVKSEPPVARSSKPPPDVETPRLEARASAKTRSTKNKEKPVNQPKAAKAQDAEKSKAAKAKAAEKAKALKEKAKLAKAKAAEKAAKAKEKAKLAKAKAAEKAKLAKEKARIAKARAAEKLAKAKERARAQKEREKARALKAKEKERAAKAKEKAKLAKVKAAEKAPAPKAKPATKARPAKVSKVAAAPIAAKVAKAPKAPRATKAKAAAPKAAKGKAAPKAKARRAAPTA